MASVAEPRVDLSITRRDVQLGLGRVPTCMRDERCRDTGAQGGRMRGVQCTDGPDDIIFRRERNHHIKV